MLIIIADNKEEYYKFKRYFRQIHNICVRGCSMLFPECKDDTLCSFKEMQMLEVEYYILAIKDETKKIMMRGFMEMNGIFPDKIFDFYKVYHASVPELNIDRLLYCQKEKSYEGIIFGISHAEVGILTRFMTKNFLNVAMSHQDLYYNLRTLEYLVENYPERLQYLKYAVIIMVS